MAPIITSITQDITVITPIQSIIIHPIIPKQNAAQTASPVNIIATKQQIHGATTVNNPHIEAKINHIPNWIDTHNSIAE